MTWAALLGSIIGAIGILAGVYRAYITWDARRDAKRDKEQEQQRGDKYQREAEIHAAPRRDKLAILERMRQGRDS